MAPEGAVELLPVFGPEMQTWPPGLLSHGLEMRTWPGPSARGGYADWKEVAVPKMDSWVNCQL